jgi:DNA-binding beta-propeller fold protein YncE
MFLTLDPDSARRPGIATGRVVATMLPVLMLAVACSNSTNAPVPALMTIAPDTVTLQRLDSVQLTVVVSDKDTAPITGAKVTFASSDPTIIRVSAAGKVLAVGGIGPATVTVTAGGVAQSAVINVFGRVALNSAPYGAAASVNGVVYITPILGPAVRRLNVSTYALTDVVLVGGDPAQVQFDGAGTTAFVTKRAGGLVGIINVASHSQTDSIVVPGNPYPIRVLPNGATAFVTSTDGWLYKLDVGSHSIVDSLLMPDPALQMAWGPGDSLLYVSSEGLGTVTEVRVATMTVVRTIPVGGTPQALAVAPNGSELYVADESGPLRIMSLVTMNQVDTVATGGATFGVALNPTGSTLYVGTTAGKIVVIDRLSRSILRVYSVGGTPRLIAVDPVSGTAVVPNEAGEWIDVVR